MPRPVLQAMVLADHVYQDRVSGKYIIAGTFGRVSIRTSAGQFQPAPPGARPAVHEPAEARRSEPLPHEARPVEPQPIEPRPIEPQPTQGRPSEPLPTEPPSAPPRRSEAQPTEPRAHVLPPTVQRANEPRPAEPQPSEIRRSAAPPTPAPPSPVSPTQSPPTPAPPIPARSGAEKGIHHSLETAMAQVSVAGSPFLYLALTGVHGKVPLTIQFVCLTDSAVMFNALLEVVSADPVALAEYCIPMPQLPVSKSGVYSLDLLYGGEILGSWRLIASDA